MKYKYNFKKFIADNVELIFGSGNTKIGRPITLAYKKQINALDIKMNEIIFGDKAENDKVFLLGLFDLAINQFGKTLSSDIDSYRDAFYDFLDNGKEKI